MPVYQIDRFALKKATVKLVGFFFFRTLQNAKKSANRR